MMYRFKAFGKRMGAKIHQKLLSTEWPSRSEVSQFAGMCAGMMIFTEYVAQVTLCMGPSMEPTFDTDGEMALLEKASVQIFHTPFKRGEVVVSLCPTNKEKRICKRIAAVGGELVVREQHYGRPPLYTYVPPGYVFLKGDNPYNSTDSRDYGPVPVDLIVGRIKYKFGWFSMQEVSPFPPRDPAVRVFAIDQTQSQKSTTTTTTTDNNSPSGPDNIKSYSKRQTLSPQEHQDVVEAEKQETEEQLRKRNRAAASAERYQAAGLVGITTSEEYYAARRAIANAATATATGPSSSSPTPPSSTPLGSSSNNNSTTQLTASACEDGAAAATQNK